MYLFCCYDIFLKTFMDLQTYLIYYLNLNKSFSVELTTQRFAVTTHGYISLFIFTFLTTFKLIGDPLKPIV